MLADEDEEDIWSTEIEWVLAPRRTLYFITSLARMFNIGLRVL